MAPSPENDSPPKAPDKEEKRGPPDDRTQPADARCADDGSKQETDFFNLNEKDLKHLLDEAISYKSPKDREGKSELFNNLLTDAENELRNARATSASGPETVRHYNKRATKRHGKGRKASSISENLTHSGSLNNLTKEDLFEETIRQRPKKTVSARQTEGGSLPCNVNVGAFDQYLDDFRPIREMSEIKATIGVANEREMTAEAVRKKNEADVIESLNSLSLKGKKSQKVASVDDRIPVSVLDHVPSVDVVEYKKSTETTITNSFLPSNLTGGLAFAGRGHKDEKKVDENCNAVPQQTADGRKGKAKKRPMEKNVTVWESSKVTGHRSDIINDVDKLIDYIDGTDMRKDKSGKSNVPKKLQKHIFDDGKAGGKKQRTRAKAKNGGDLQKSNSLEEISTTKIEDFEFLPESDDVVLRQTKSNTDRPRERRSWGTSEPVQVQALYTNASAENLETADFRVVTKKKKSKKQRRNSLSSRKTYREEAAGEFNRVPSPEPRRKSAISVPHSERSNDSSDVDSVHSLPVDATNLSREMADDDGTFPISYADIAKNSNSGSVNSSNSGTSGSEKGGSVSSNSSGVANNRGDGRAVRKEKLKTGSIEKQGSVEVGVEASKAEKDSSDKVKVKKEECKKPAAAAAKVEKEVPKAEEKAATNAINNSVNYSQNFPSIIPKDKNENKVRNPIAEIQTWPAIPNNNNNNKNNLKNSIANTQKKMQNHFKNTKNIIAAQQKPDKNNLHNSFASMQNSADATTTTLIYNNYNMPINIPDVRSIEKQFKNSAKLYNAETQSDNCETAKADAAVQMSEIKKAVAAQEDVVRNSAVQCEILQKDECCLNLNNAMSSEVTNNTGINLAVINSSLNRTINNAINNNNNLTHNNNNNKANAATVASPTCTLTSTSTTNTTTFNNNNNNSSNANYNAAVNVVNANSNSAAANPNLTTASSNRPAVVILSGGAEKEVSGITFGFDIEQLLSNDVCADFMTRFVPPRGDDDVGKCFNLDKIVSFIGIAWEDVIKESNGKVKYYTESL